MTAAATLPYDALRSSKIEAREVVRRRRDLALIKAVHGDIPPGVTVARNHAPFGTTRHSWASTVDHVVHRVERVLIYWHDSPPGVAASWLCGGYTLSAVLIDTVPSRLCLACDIPQQTGPMVYFAEFNGLIKIGCSRNLRRRMASLGARLLAAIPGDFAKEKEIHREYAYARSHGEWFLRDPSLMNFIASIEKAS